jgi:predicted methyltransferase
MRIDTLFDIDADVFYIYKTDYVEEAHCEVCGGTGTATIIPDASNLEKKFKVTCPTCEGEGIVPKTHFEWFASKETKVVEVKVFVKKGDVKNPKVFYSLVFNGDSRRGLHVTETPRGPVVVVPEEEVFFAYAGAKLKAEKRNEDERSIDLEQAR